MQSTLSAVDIMQRQLSLLLEQAELQKHLIAIATEPPQPRHQSNVCRIEPHKWLSGATAPQPSQPPRVGTSDSQSALTVAIQPPSCTSNDSSGQPTRPRYLEHTGFDDAMAESVPSVQIPLSSSRWLALTGLLPLNEDLPMWRQALQRSYICWCGSMAGMWIFTVFTLLVTWGVLSDEMVARLMGPSLMYCAWMQICWFILRRHYSFKGGIRKLLCDVAAHGDFSWKIFDRMACCGLAAALTIAGLLACANLAEHSNGTTWAHSTQDGKRLFSDAIAAVRLAILVLVVTPSMFIGISVMFVAIGTVFLVSALHCHDMKIYVQQFLAIVEKGGEVPVIVRRLHLLEQAVASRLKRSNEAMSRLVTMLIMSSGCGMLLSLLTFEIRMQFNCIVFMIGAGIMFSVLVALAKIADCYMWEVMPSLNTPFVLQAAQTYFGQQWGGHVRQQASTWGFRLGGGVVNTKSVAQSALGTLVAFLLSMVKSAMSP